MVPIDSKIIPYNPILKKKKDQILLWSNVLAYILNSNTKNPLLLYRFKVSDLKPNGGPMNYVVEWYEI